MTARSEELYRRALGLMPGGVNSPVRAMRSIGRDHPVFAERGEGCELIDEDGNRYVDWVCSWGPLILGHAHPRVVEAVRRAAERGTSYGAPTEGEVELAQEVCERFRSVEMARMVSSGTEASMSTVRTTPMMVANLLCRIDCFGARAWTATAAGLARLPSYGFYRPFSGRV